MLAILRGMGLAGLHYKLILAPHLDMDILAGLPQIKLAVAVVVPELLESQELHKKEAMVGMG
jgi:hypothetical protein